MLRNLFCAFSCGQGDASWGHTIYLADDARGIRELLHERAPSGRYEVRFALKEMEMLLAGGFSAGAGGASAIFEILSGQHGQPYVKCRELLCSDIPIILLTARQAGLCHGHQPGQ